MYFASKILHTCIVWEISSTLHHNIKKKLGTQEIFKTQKTRKINSCCKVGKALAKEW
jgi:hypothetical protein